MRNWQTLGFVVGLMLTGLGLSVAIPWYIERYGVPEIPWPWISALAVLVVCLWLLSRTLRGINQALTFIADGLDETNERMSRLEERMNWLEERFEEGD